MALKAGYKGIKKFIADKLNALGDVDSLATDAEVRQTLRDAEVVQGKNLLPNNATSQTVNGVTFTVNVDGSVTANGTATGIIFYDICRGLNIKKDTIINGCPSGGSDSTYDLLVTSDNGSTVYATDTGEGAVINNNATDARVFIRIRSGVTVSNKVFYPMISADGGVYEPYYIPLKDVVPNKCDNSVIGTPENGTNPTKAYAVGEHFIRDGKFCTVTVDVTTASTWTLGSNYVEGTIADNLVKKATFSGTTHSTGGYLKVADGLVRVIGIYLDINNRHAISFHNETDTYVTVYDNNGGLVVDTSVSGTYYYI